jgi:hypothetical protein
MTIKVKDRSDFTSRGRIIKAFWGVRILFEEQ